MISSATPAVPGGTAVAVTTTTGGGGGGEGTVVTAAEGAKAERPQKVVVKIEQDHIICKVQKITLQQQQQQQRARIRKRKERQESTSSQHVQKVIRSNSEERPKIMDKKPSSTNNDDGSNDDKKIEHIRRVSSSGDFPKSISLDEKPVVAVKPENQKKETASKKVDNTKTNGNNDNDNDALIISEDHEYEKRRSHERFARPHNLRKPRTMGKRYNKPHIIIKSGSKGAKGQGNEKEISTKNSNNVTNGTNTQQPQYLKVQTIDYNTNPEYISPISPVLDFSTLQQSIQSTEPVLSRSINYLLNEDDDNEDDSLSSPILSEITSNPMLLSSPKTSIIAKHRIYMDPDVPNVKLYDEQKAFNPVNERIQKLNKLINSHKKKIKIREADYEEQFGFKPSHFDKLKDGVLRKLYEDLCKHKKELKQLSELSPNYPLISLNQKVILKKPNVTLQETINSMDQLSKNYKDNVVLESMTPEQLQKEKLDMQKALLYLESIHGRVQKKEDLELVQKYYDRYQLLKRLVAKINNTAGAGELATIHENEAMTFVTTTTSGSESDPNLETNQMVNQNKSIVSRGAISILTTATTDSSTSSSTSSNENIHSLSKFELQERLKIVIEEKKVLKRKIREFEISIQNQTGRILLTKEDKKPMEESYLTYKSVKGRKKLLEALISK